ncbi:MAG: transcription elongation factor GreA [Candidatus Moraniibacteriota bacterium]
MSDKKILTKEGYKKLVEELEERRVTVRQRISQEIKEAKEQGDLSENAEYTEARHDQNDNENRIAELESLLKVAEVSSSNGKTDVVQLGSKVVVAVNNRELNFTIVGSNEVDPAQGKISNESPLGHAFLGKKKGDEVTVEAPVGMMSYTVIDVA